MSEEQTASLAVRSPRALLEELARLGKVLVGNGRARPEIELVLAAGCAVRGRVIGVGAVEDGPIAVVQVGGTPRAPSVSFVRIAAIAAITVVDASVLVDAPVADARVPSRLELARQAAQRAEGLASALGHPVAFELATDLGDDDRRAIGGLLPIACEVLAAIAADELGRAALASVARIDLGAGAQADVQLVRPDTLVLRAPRLWRDAYTAPTLRAAIEKLL